MAQPAAVRKRKLYFRTRRLRTKEKGYLKRRIVSEIKAKFPKELMGY